MEKVRYLTAGTNSGIGTALNTAGRMAVQEGYEYLLTMDQDSVASVGMIRTMLACPVDTAPSAFSRRSISIARPTSCLRNRTLNRSRRR